MSGHDQRHYDAHNGDHSPPPAACSCEWGDSGNGETGPCVVLVRHSSRCEITEHAEQGLAEALSLATHPLPDLELLAAAAAAAPLVGEAARSPQFASEDEYYAYEARRGGLAGTPEQLGCFECGGFDGRTEPLRTVVGLGGVVEAHRDPTQTYRLVCGHVAL